MIQILQETFTEEGVFGSKTWTQTENWNIIHPCSEFQMCQFISWGWFDFQFNPGGIVPCTFYNKATKQRIFIFPISRILRTISGASGGETSRSRCWWSECLWILWWDNAAAAESWPTMWSQEQLRGVNKSTLCCVHTSIYHRNRSRLLSAPVNTLSGNIRSHVPDKLFLINNHYNHTVRQQPSQLQSFHYFPCLESQ